MGMKTKKCPTEDWAQRTDAGLALLPLVYPCTFLTPYEPVPAAPRITDPQDHLRHPGMAKVEIIPFGLQTFNPHLSPRSQRRCYLNDLGNECVHQRHKDIVYYLCACFPLWNFLIYFKINYTVENVCPYSEVKDLSCNS